MWRSLMGILSVSPLCYSGSKRRITMQQHGKNIQNGRPQHFVSSNMTKATHSSLDEFKYGFPSDGLAVVSIKWWGSSSLGSNGDISVKGERDFEEAKRTEELVDDGACMSVINEEKPGIGNNESNSSPQGTGLLSCIRKRAAEEGREALRLGVHRGHGINKLDRRERKLLLQIFRSSMPSHLKRGSSQS
ncbi:uncharacterized protein LOC127792105 [Diospyros lotus]|uniref:uncharacterized protein LOC127792105 n=1 Tax=Diospyros lotus TaxID=55363 RepID=UPI0022541E97|nr:uncharacterized protein LOC127792105 [Diospyros lotus]XP_052178418.1 uncharacterized protein LOC127792105 [Diospyros lotus]